MSETIGRIIDGGESQSDGDSTGASGPSERASEPEIINGYDSFEPRTERIKLTKSGKPDRRTKQYRNTGSDGTEASREETGKVHLSKLDIGELLFSIHLTLSEFTKIPELELEKGEADELGSAVKEFAKFYGASFDPKKVALFNLCLAAGKIYIPRAIAVKKNRMGQTKGPQLVERPQPQRKEQPQATPVNIPLDGMAPSDIWQQSGTIG